MDKKGSTTSVSIRSILRKLLNMFVQPRHATLEGKSYDVYLEDFLKNKDCPVVPRCENLRTSSQYRLLC